MPAAGRSRTYGIVAASMAAHGLLATLLVLNAPRLRVPEMQSGPPEAIIPILIMPRTPPPSAAPGAQPTQIRLHRRVTRFSDDQAQVTPLVAPAEDKPVERAAPASGPRVLTLPSQEDALAANARNALRSRRNCDDPAMSRIEREACQDRFFAGGRDAPPLGLGINRDKAEGLAAAGARKDRDFKYQRSVKGSAPATGALPWDTVRGPPGPAAALGSVAGSDNVEKKIPF
ncbi:MAG: hypothetical protein KKE02_23745 [Alphaproteobacteria bacterium]|nr:hypothetical protein [Alphaproteobacteria bacterium]MBU1516175.1 hypothetical protein [Alphaproteobacteria bacterium]MBU2096543.1 hypothetical protein [Alphaproteobacteria bacterium]MBU2154051.1 hypothetical protein [Alphaproteobacteria bacterium]MBU2309693.1 hypothetical protein [Alphaproteobacteria bacterium]